MKSTEHKAEKIASAVPRKPPIRYEEPEEPSESYILKIFVGLRCIGSLEVFETSDGENWHSLVSLAGGGTARIAGTRDEAIIMAKYYVMHRWADVWLDYHA